MIRYLRVIATALLVAVVALAALPATVLGIADPDTPPSVNAVYVYEDLLAPGDLGVFIDYYLDYAVLPTIANPDDTATAAYMGVFVDTDTTTQLKTSAPYSFHDSGYGRGIIWIYFSPAEVTLYSIDAVDIALYRIWLVGNPTIASGWTGVPPKTIATIDDWFPAPTATLLAQRVLDYADILGSAWTLTLRAVTAIGYRLTVTGELYFENAIPSLRDMAPSAFAAGSSTSILEDIDYTTEFGAAVTDSTCVPSGGTATIAGVAGVPLELASGTQSINITVLGASGTFTITLDAGTVGTVTDDIGTVAGSPLDIIAGANVITGTGLGNVTVVVNLVDTTTGFDTSVVGTGFDLTTIATTFGMSRWMFSGILWMVLSVIICAAAYRVRDRYEGSAGKAVMIIFDLCIVIGILMGLLKPIVGILMFIGFLSLTGYILFYRGANV